MKKKNNSSNFLTKEFFLKSIDALLKGIRNEIKFSVEVVTEKLERRMQEINDRNFTKLDSISKELEEMREDRTIGGHQIKEKLHNHEKRIAKLEHVNIPAQFFKFLSLTDDLENDKVYLMRNLIINNCKTTTIS